MRNKLFGILLVMVLASLARAEAPASEEKSVSNLLASVRTKLAAITAPTDYRTYMSVYFMDSHDAYISLRDAWLDTVRALANDPGLESLGLADQNSLKEFAGNKFLQQLSLDEVAYYASVYPAWDKALCKKTVLPTIRGFNLVFGAQGAPFGYSRLNSILLAYYLSFPFTEKYVETIQGCLRANDETVAFLQVGLLTSHKTGKKLLPGELPPTGSYRADGLGVDLKITNSEVCIPNAPLPEDHCFASYGKAAASRRN